MTIADPSLPLQKAILARLNADTGVNAIVAGRIYDGVPASAVKPYVSFGGFEVLPEAADCSEGADVTITLDGWATGPSTVTVKRLGAAIAASLQWADMSLDEGQRLVIMAIESVFYMRDPDGITAHAIVTVRAQTEPIPPAPPAPTFPDASNTGVPPGTVLTPSGGFTVSTNGAVIQNLNVTGRINVNANGVTIKNCRINADGQGWGIDADGRDVDVMDCEIFSNNNGNAAILGQGGTYQRCNIYGFENGIVTQSDNLVEDCYIHDLGGSVDAHVDGVSIQSGSNTTVRHCRIEAWDTSCVFIKDDFGQLANHVVENNLLINTPGKQTAFCVYSVGTGPGTGVSGTIFRDNIMQAGAGGYASVEENTVTWTNNRDYITGAVIPPP